MLSQTIYNTKTYQSRSFMEKFSCFSFTFALYSTESQEPSVYVKAIPWALGALVLILVIAVTVLIVRGRNLRGNKNKTWILLATREQSGQEGKPKDQLQTPQAEM